MRINQLELHDFRSYKQWEIEPNSALTIFSGPNAIGKTNIIEAIQLVATGASFRKPHWDEVVRWGATRALVTMTADGEGSHAEVELKVEADGSRIWRVGGAQKRRVTDACRYVPVVTFTPDDLSLVKGPAEQRRAALDALGDQLSATYGTLKRDYTRVIKQRNTLLRDNATQTEIQPWDDQLIRLGGRLHIHRRRLAKRVLDTAAPIYRHLAGTESLDMRFCDRCGVSCEDLSVELDDQAVETTLGLELAKRRSDERARGVSLVGPHRDDITFLIEGRDARSFASQGQLRTIALAWKWAEVVVVTQVLHKTPILLLDDVMSELDEVRRAALTDLIQRDVQTFVTTTTTNYFDPALLREARVVTLNGAM